MNVSRETLQIAVLLCFGIFEDNASLCTMKQLTFKYQYKEIHLLTQLLEMLVNRP